MHAGAGTLRRESLTPEREAAIRAALTQALQAGHAILARGGSSVEAVTAAVRMLEDSPHFNAGRRAVLNHELEQAGHLAAATSTRGTNNERFGRVGDSPIIGAGTYANARCAVSATGHGEYFIRSSVAHDICARLEYLGRPLEEAARAVVMDVLVKAGGDGGIIAMDSEGHMALHFNTRGMYRGQVGPEGTPSVALFRE